MTVWICQCLCPSRHSIMATTGEADSESVAEQHVRAPLRQELAALLKEGLLNGWCALCGADQSTWRHELRRTVYRTMDEAMPALIREEGANLATNVLWGDLHKTSRPN